MATLARISLAISVGCLLHARTLVVGPGGQGDAPNPVSTGRKMVGVESGLAVKWVIRQNLAWSSASLARKARIRRPRITLKFFPES